MAEEVVEATMEESEWVIPEENISVPSQSFSENISSSVSELQTRTLRKVTSVSYDERSPLKWKKSSTSLLLSLIKKYKPQFETPHVTKKRVWGTIAQELCTPDFQVSATQVENKWKGLCKIYNRHKNNPHMGKGIFTDVYNQKVQELLGNSDSDSVGFEKSSMRCKIANSSARKEPFCTLSSFKSKPRSEIIEIRMETPIHNSDNFPIKKEMSEVDVPEWFKIYSEGVERRHQEHMALQRQMMEQSGALLEHLINVIQATMGVTPYFGQGGTT